MSGKPLDQQIAELKLLVQKLADPKIDIDESVKLFEQGVKLSGEIEKRINEYEIKITMLTGGEKGEQRDN